MFDCSCLYRDNSGDKKKKIFIKLQRHGIVYIKLKEKKFDGNGIASLARNISYVITVYKKSCKTIVFTCKEFNPADKLTYILFETIVYNLRVNHKYNVELELQDIKPSIITEGILDTTIYKKFLGDYALEEYKKRFRFEQNTIHFRRLFTREQSERIGVSSLLGELKTFFKTSNLKKENTDQLASVICELVDNAGEHTQSD